MAKWQNFLPGKNNNNNFNSEIIFNGQSDLTENEIVNLLNKYFDD